MTPQPKEQKMCCDKCFKDGRHFAMIKEKLSECCKAIIWPDRDSKGRISNVCEKCGKPCSPPRKYMKSSTPSHIRELQQEINAEYRTGKYKFPIHFAFGHENLASGVVSSMEEGDFLVLPHRNISYNLAAEPTDAKTYLCHSLGSMNHVNPKKGIVYTSSILGNNFSVACGLAKTQKNHIADPLVKNREKKTIVVAGDGAIEEGSFYESLMLAKSLYLPIIFFIENNGWSLATKIYERRCNLDLKELASSLNTPYIHLPEGARSEEVKEALSYKPLPLVIEAEVRTLGGYDRDGRFINYHAGPVENLDLNKT